MSTNTAIQWTDVTDNILVVDGGGWWCRMISPGCAHCYAAKLNQSAFFGGNKLPYTGNAPDMILRREVCDAWARQTKPKRHFVSSMTDVFGEWLTQCQVDYFLYSMLFACNQTFQVLTKRPDVAKRRISTWLDGAGLTQLPDNIWLGVSVEDQKRANERIPILLSIPARVRFLSVEPMLERIDFGDVPIGMLGPLWSTPKIDWVIFGGESGKNARPCNIEHIRDGVQQCQAAGVKAFVKQVGSNAVFGEWAHWPAKHPKGGDPSEWPADVRLREFPTL